MKARLRFFQHFRYFYVSNHQSPYADRCRSARHDGLRLSSARPLTLPFETLYISYNLNTPLGSQLSRQLKAGSDVRLVNSPSEAQAILYILGERRSRNVVAYNAYGDAREYELKLEVSFRLAAPDGALYLPDTVIPAVREISYNEEDYLTRDTEEALVINEMLSDIVVQMVRRIEKAQPPKQPEDLTTR